MPQALDAPPSPHAPINSAHENVADEGRHAEKRSFQPAKASFFSRARILGPVEKEHGDLPLLACCLVTGLVDAASFSNWGVFVGMQTGNTVILGLSTAGLPSNPHAWLTTLVSLASFLVGGFCTFRISKVITPNGPTASRLWSASLFMSQALFILLSAVLATPSGIIPQNPVDTSSTYVEPPFVIKNIHIVALIPPLAFQSGIQIATSRLLGFNELPVNVLTSTYCDIVGDFKLLALNNVRRNRRVAAAVLVLVGAICSGWLMRSAAGLKGVLWIAGGIKLLTAVAMFCFMPTLTKALP